MIVLYDGKRLSKPLHRLSEIVCFCRRESHLALIFLNTPTATAIQTPFCFSSTRVSVIYSGVAGLRFYEKGFRCFFTTRIFLRYKNTPAGAGYTIP